MQRYKPFVQDWGVFPSDTFVVVGLNHKEVIASMKRFKFDAERVKAYDTDGADLNYEDQGFVWRMGGVTVLWLHDWDDDEEHLDLLVHETNHMVYGVLGKHRSMLNETEAQAYTQAYLFTQIRKKLNAQKQNLSTKTLPK